MNMNKTFNDIINRIEKLIQEGNVRRIIIKDSNRKIFMEFPIVIGIIGIFAAPIISSIGLLTGILSNFSIEVINRDDEKETDIFEVKIDE